VVHPDLFGSVQSASMIVPGLKFLFLDEDPPLYALPNGIMCAIERTGH
jgi:hypothetical protein